MFECVRFATAAAVCSLLGAWQGEGELPSAPREAGSTALGDSGGGFVAYSNDGTGVRGGKARAAGSTASAGPSSQLSVKCSTPSMLARNAVARDKHGNGQVTQTNVCVPELGVISSITLKYMFSSYFGEPMQRAVFAYHADFDIAYALWVAQVYTIAGTEVKVNGRPVYASWIEGSWRKPGGTFGTDMTGSPSWSETFTLYSGDTTRGAYLDATASKNIYKAGFTLDRLRMVSVNKKTVLY